MRFLKVAFNSFLALLFFGIVPICAKADSVCHTPASSFNAALAVELGVCDASGNLMVKMSPGSTANPGYTRIQDGTTTNLATVSTQGYLSTTTCGTLGVCQQVVNANNDTQNASASANVASYGHAYNGTAWERLRTAAGITGGSAPTGLGAVGVCNANSSAGVCAQVGAPNGDGFPTGANGINSIAFSFGYSGTGWDRIRTTQAFNGYQTGLLATGVVSNEPITATYVGTTSNVANTASGVYYEITGAAGHVIRVRRCTVTHVATAVAQVTDIARVLSTTDTGGTSTSATLGPVDSGSAATAATVLVYSAPPTQGTVQSAPFVQFTTVEPITATAGVLPQIVTMDFPNTENAQPPTLRSGSQQFVLAVLGTPGAGASTAASCTFTDTAT